MRKKGLIVIFIIVAIAVMACIIYEFNKPVVFGVVFQPNIDEKTATAMLNSYQAKKVQYYPPKDRMGLPVKTSIGDIETTFINSALLIRKLKKDPRILDTTPISIFDGQYPPQIFLDFHNFIVSHN